MQNIVQKSNIVFQETDLEQDEGEGEGEKVQRCDGGSCLGLPGLNYAKHSCLGLPGLNYAKHCPKVE